MHGWRIVVVMGYFAAPALGQQSVLDSSHNLSVTGPGEIRAATEPEVCIFCHTSHRSAAVQPLWNRASSGVPYTVYSSRALDANPGQPTGASKMCLSCHDGSIALGSVLSRDQIIHMAGGITTLRPGSAGLGTDLSDDHPISFRYDATLAVRDARLVNPTGLATQIRLDADSELQCTSCHDPHDDSFGNFLVMDNRDSSLCLACHAISNTTVQTHEQCNVCHKSHSAPSGPYLLVEQTVTETCMSCHDGSMAQAENLAADLARFSVHDTESPIDPAEGSAHTTCSDCHEPHTMVTGSPARAPALAASMGQLPGVASGGGRLESASYEYEVCFQCHGDESVLRNSSPVISRQIVQTSTRLQFDPGGPSYHPVVAAGRNTNVPSLRPPWTEGSLVLCSDCHGSSDSRKAGGFGPNGVHGSMYAPILLERYETLDFTPESSVAYALCYRCHQRDGFNGILQDVSFPHEEHVVDERTPCSACHDAHGINSVQGSMINNSHLINFDTSIVFPDPNSGKLEYRSEGTFSGSCNLTCHGKLHVNKQY